MGFKKEKLLSGLLARNPKDSPQETIPSPTGTSKSSVAHNATAWYSEEASDTGRTQDSSDLTFKETDPVNDEVQNVTNEDDRDSHAKNKRKRDLDLMPEDKLVKNKAVPLVHSDQEKQDTQHVSNNEATANPEALELSSVPHALPHVEVEVDSLTASEGHSTKKVERSHHDHTKTCRDSNKLTVVLSNTIPLSFDSIDQGTVACHSAPIPNVTCVHRLFSSEVMPLAYHRRLRQDHDYCFASTHLDSPFPVESYDFPLSDYSICSTTALPSLAWNEYQPIRVAESPAQPVRERSARSLNHATWATSSCWYLNLDSKEDMIALHNIGLTAISLERLAETGSISESLFPTEKSRADKRNDRIKKRRETFVSVITGNSKKQAQCHQPSYHCNNPLVKKWIKLDTLEVDEVSQLLDDITDILYKRKEKERRKPDCGSTLHHGISLARRRLLFDHGCTSPESLNDDQGGTLSPQKQTRARVISSVRRQLQYFDGQGRIPETSPHTRQCHKNMKSRGLPGKVTQETAIHQKIRALYAKSLASTTSTTKERFYLKSNINDVHSNPPTWERSRSICSRGSSHTQSCKELEGDSTRSWHNSKKQESRNEESGTSCRSLRSRTINISTKNKRPLKIIHENIDEREQGRNGADHSDEETSSNTVDDLRTQLGAYGDQSAKTPHIDALAARSLVFDRAYCQVAVCSPSRASLLTGRRPDTNHVWTINPNGYWRTFTNATTIPQYFKNNGYTSIGMGKIFHRGRPSGEDDIAYSWSVPYYHGTDDVHSPNSWHCFDNISDNALTDGKIADKAIETLKEIKENRTEGDSMPFFLAVGFHKPHLPFFAPTQYCNMYPPAEEIPLAKNPNTPSDMPPIAWTTYQELQMYTDMRKYNLPACRDDADAAMNGRISDTDAQLLRRSYYASLSFIDSLIGKVMSEFESQGLDENAIVVFWGDHGWKLGEHNLWGKFTNLEDDTHVPFMLRVPGVTDSGSHSCGVD